MNGRAAQVLRGHQATHELAVVVIARNEERHIARSLDALMVALENRPGTPVLLVDSGSSDATIEIAAAYPIDIYRYAGPPYTAAAGRRVGFERTSAQYVMFIDGDCCIERGWLDRALDLIQQDPRAGVIYGQRREVFEDATEQAAAAAPTPEEYALGGNALYRAEAMHRAGGFNPYLAAGEEAELLGRIVAAGYHELAMKEVMFTHYTLAKSTVRGFVSRLRRGLSRGPGQTLRLAIAQGLFMYHARRLNRYLVTSIYLMLGAVAAIASLLARSVLPFVAWVAIAALAFLLLTYRRNSLRSAAFIAAEWITTAIHIPADFARSPPQSEDFDPQVEHLRRVRSNREVILH